ncbi:hypothetical protein [Actinoplanes xinjiangensis]|uniref:hypothetical protein n=1 Tax=Actinoplanes xinjiangensis TaxID=512350 RepID=UPI00342EB868
MERGPLALFGAILAVGVGPALWLGAQLGAVNLAPGQRPAPVGEQFPGVDMDFGGAGAGELPDDDEPLITYTYTPLTPATAVTSVKPSPVATGDSLPSRTVPPAPPPPVPTPTSATPPSSPSPSSSSADPSAGGSTTPSVEPSTSVSSSASAVPE